MAWTYSRLSSIWVRALDFILDHHEHWDGTGYPRGISGAGISIGGRVLTAADAFDALTSKRAYRDPMTPASTLEYLNTQIGRLLDPEVFTALGVVVKRGEVPEIPRM